MVRAGQLIPAVQKNEQGHREQHPKQNPQPKSRGPGTGLTQVLGTAVLGAKQLLAIRTNRLCQALTQVASRRTRVINVDRLHARLRKTLQIPFPRVPTILVRRVDRGIRSLFYLDDIRFHGHESACTAKAALSPVVGTTKRATARTLSRRWPLANIAQHGQ
jgi:hypothetical protein